MAKVVVAVVATTGEVSVGTAGDYIFKCPHCEGGVSVEKNQVNCRIFRHGTHKVNGRQMNPHTPKEECFRLATSKLIYGCGLPFRLVPLDDNKKKWRVEKCDYI